MIAVLPGLPGARAWSAEEGWTKLGPDALRQDEPWLVAADAIPNPAQDSLLVATPGKGGWSTRKHQGRNR